MKRLLWLPLTLLLSFPVLGQSSGDNFRRSSFAISDGIDVRKFGARCDGATNDTTAIQNAENAAYPDRQRVVFPDGICMASTLIKYSDSLWVGQGRNATIIKQIAETNADFITSNSAGLLWDTNSVGGVTGQLFANLTIDGNSLHNVSGNCLSIYGYAYVMKTVTIQNCAGVGLRSQWSKGGSNSMEAKITDITVFKVGSHGVQWFGPHDSYFNQLLVIDAGQSAGTFTPVFSQGSATIGYQGNALQVNQKIRFSNSGGTLPKNFSTAIDYYVLSKGLSSSQFEVAEAPAGVAIVAGSGGSGTQIATIAHFGLWVDNGGTARFSGYHGWHNGDVIYRTKHQYYTTSGFNNFSLSQFEGSVGAPAFLGGSADTFDFSNAYYAPFGSSSPSLQVMGNDNIVAGFIYGCPSQPACGNSGAHVGVENAGSQNLISLNIIHSDAGAINFGHGINNNVRIIGAQSGGPGYVGTPSSDSTVFLHVFGAASLPTLTQLPGDLRVNGALIHNGEKLNIAGDVAVQPSAAGTDHGLRIYEDDSVSNFGTLGFNSTDGFTFSKPLKVDGSISATGFVDGSIGGLKSAFGTPKSSNAACVKGQVQFDAMYLYTCVATNKWRRVATGSF